MRALLFACLTLLAGCTNQEILPTAADSDNAFGKKGACIGNEAYSVCAFSVGLIEKDSKPIAFVSTKSLGLTADGKPIWEKLDEISLPLSLDGKLIEFGSCRYAGRSDDTLVALVPKYGPNSPEYIPAVDWAYKVTLPSGEFQEVDPNKVDCVNTAIGAD